jgi:pilus assembly protein FimV
MLIAAPAQSSVDERLIDEVVDQISTPAAMADTDMDPAALHKDLPPQPTYLTEDFAIAMDQEAADDSMDSTLEAELDTLFNLDTKPAMESAEVQYPDEILPPDAIHPVDDDLADDFIEAQLSDRRGLQPALSDTNELAGYSEDAETLDLPAQSDLAEQLDFLFSDTEDDSATAGTPLSPLELEALKPVSIVDAEPVAALADFEPERFDQNEQFPVADALSGKNDEVLAALADSEWPDDAPDRRAGEDDSDQGFLDIQNKLDHFFADTPEELSEPKVSAADGVEEVEQALFFTEENGVESALADSTEERGFSEDEAIATLDDTPLDEIEEKLDFFFGSETDEQLDTEKAADDLTMTATAEEDKVAFQNDLPALFTDDLREEEAVDPTLSDNTTPALADVDDLLMEEVIEAPGFALLDRELEGKLDLFFDQEDVLIASEEPADEPVDALTRALEAAFDDEQPATVDLSEDEPVHPAATEEEDRQIHLAALGALLPGIVRAASREQAAESSRLTEALNSVDLSAEHRSLLQMLDSVIGLLARLPVQDGADTEKLVNYLYEQLLQEECRPEVLSTAVHRFTTWLQQASAQMPLVPAATKDVGNEPHFAYTAKELYFELAELRAHIKDEFAKLRHEMHHHKS